MHGRGGHSGNPGGCVNAVELAMSVMPVIQRHFYSNICPPLASEAEYRFMSGSSLSIIGIESQPGTSAQVYFYEFMLNIIFDNIEN